MKGSKFDGSLKMRDDASVSQWPKVFERDLPSQPRHEEKKVKIKLRRWNRMEKK